MEYRGHGWAVLPCLARSSAGFDMPAGDAEGQGPSAQVGMTITPSALWPPAPVLVMTLRRAGGPCRGTRASSQGSSLSRDTGGGAVPHVRGGARESSRLPGFSRQGVLISRLLAGKESLLVCPGKQAVSGVDGQVHASIDEVVNHADGWLAITFKKTEVRLNHQP